MITSRRNGVILPDWPAPVRVRAASTLRAGGVSRGAYASLNLSAGVGDDEANVARNRRILAEMLDLPTEPMWLRQVHGTTVLDLDRADAPAAARHSGQPSPGSSPHNLPRTVRSLRGPAGHARYSPPTACRCSCATPWVHAYVRPTPDGGDWRVACLNRPSDAWASTLCRYWRGSGPVSARGPMKSVAKCSSSSRQSTGMRSSASRPIPTAAGRRISTGLPVDACKMPV